jgi:hypothetical protein
VQSQIPRELMLRDLVVHLLFRMLQGWAQHLFEELVGFGCAAEFAEHTCTVQIEDFALKGGERFVA